MEHATPKTGQSEGSVDTDPGEMGVNERLGIIGLIDEGMRMGSSEAPVMSDLFQNLWDLVDATVLGSKIDRLKPEASLNGFRVFEINAESGENLGRMNMLYLKKPISCYYLVYVEVAAPFRRKGLGHRILEHFREFLVQKSAVGILDNIIPSGDPTYDIYDKNGWEPVEAVIGDAIPDLAEHYMIYIPPRFHDRELREPVLKLMYHLKRKRASIDMRDNEMMVQRTITEFRELYAALESYFESHIGEEEPDPLMRFMFTRFATKFIAFRRRIADLLGYTGGDSLEQFVLRPEIASLPVQTYAPFSYGGVPRLLQRDAGLWLRLPEALKMHPARFVDFLPNYQRPSLKAWMKARSRDPRERLSIGDLMDLGFDPTRLKELVIDGEEFIFERIQLRQIRELERKTALLNRIRSRMVGVRVRGAEIKTNPPLLVIQDKGNAYVLRKKVEGVHWDEAVEQLQSADHLKELNSLALVDRQILATVREANEGVATCLEGEEERSVDMLSWFVSWDLASNLPKLSVDAQGTCLTMLWAS